jgi:hypothetical protein
MSLLGPLLLLFPLFFEFLGVVILTRGAVFFLLIVLIVHNRFLLSMG